MLFGFRLSFRCFAHPVDPKTDEGALSIRRSPI